MTDFRARGTIMGPTGLTAVFGMGTGVTPPVWSPEMRTPGGQAATVARCNQLSRHSGGRSRRQGNFTVNGVGPIRSLLRVDPHGRGSFVMTRGIAGIFLG